MFAWRCCTLHAVQAAQFAGVRVFQRIRRHGTRPETAAWVHFAIVEPEGVGRMEVCVGDDGDVLTNLAFVRVAETHRHHGRLRSEICQEQEALSPGPRLSTIATVSQSHFRVPPNPDSHPKTMRRNPATPENNTTTAPCKLCRTYIMSHNHQNLMRFEHVAKFIPFCQSVPYGWLYMQQLSYPILWWLVTCNKGASLRWIELYNVELYHNHRNLTTFENVAKFTLKCQCIPR